MKKKIEKYVKVKRIEKPDKDIIYEFHDFYFLFAEYMLGIGTVSKEAIKELFLEIFSEHRKGNRTAFFTYCGLNGIYEMYYLYYKYFLGLPEEEVTAKNVYGSCRKEILHWG